MEGDGEGDACPWGLELARSGRLKFLEMSHELWAIRSMNSEGSMTSIDSMILVATLSLYSCCEAPMVESAVPVNVAPRACPFRRRRRRKQALPLGERDRERERERCSKKGGGFLPRFQTHAARAGRGGRSRRWCRSMRRRGRRCRVRASRRRGRVWRASGCRSRPRSRRRSSSGSAPSN